MPPKPKTEEEIAEEKKIILDKTLNIIEKKGYSNLTMREIAKECNSSTAKIYYYFKNKEHIIFLIISLGFEKLKNNLLNHTNDLNNCEDKFITALEVIYNFGVNYSNYYNIMFGVGIPKYLDYANDPELSIIAHEQKKIGLCFYNIYSNIVQDYANSKNTTLTHLEIFAIFSKICGIIHLHNSNLLPEINIQSKELFNCTIKSIMKEFI